MTPIERNAWAQTRYDELMHEGKHGHYETLFRVVREAEERARRECIEAIMRESFHVVDEEQALFVKTIRARFVSAIRSLSQEGGEG
jgi:hypothetical protein